MSDKPKITFRDPNPKRALKRAFWGIPSDADAELDADFAESLAGWRARYLRFKRRTYIPLWTNQRAILEAEECALTPLLMDVRATLKALAKISDEDADKAVRRLDSETYTCLKRAAWMDYRRKFPEPAPIPPDALLIRQVAAGRVGLVFPPGRLRELAALALSVLHVHDGRSRINSLDHLFACALVHHWIRINGTEPSAHEASPFTKWAADKFTRVGAPLRGDQRKVLRDAINEVKKG